MFSLNNYPQFERVEEVLIKEHNEIIYYLCSLDPFISRKTFSITHPSLLFIKKEGLNLLQVDGNEVYDLPKWILEKIEDRRIMAINTTFPNWQNKLLERHPAKWRVHIAGLGDVGSTLLIGLRLLGGDCIDSIGIYDRTPDKLQRWSYEINQVYCPGNEGFPEVYPISESEFFNCDMFVFCIAKGVPPVGKDVKDVRMIQFQENANIIETFAKKARAADFKGIFAVVSDPVDLLCKVVFNSSNKDSQGNFDFKGLAPEQVRGYGLGVMHARAAYYAKENPKTLHYLKEGRAFGPHGEDLVIADSIEDYNEILSIYLTNKAKAGNLEVRKTGFKPYIAPALSSGSLSIIATIRGDWHYSATYMGGVYMGSKNRLSSSGTEVERLELPELLLQRLQNTYAKLEKMV